MYIKCLPVAYICIQQFCLVYFINILYKKYPVNVLGLIPFPEQNQRFLLDFLAYLFC